MVNVLITGSNGFIGNSLKASLEKQKISYFALNRTQGDIADTNTWKNLPQAEYVVHLAGQSYVPDSWTKASEFYQSNIVGTNNALEYAKRIGSRLIYISAYLYGKPISLPISEGHTIHPNNPYALSKHLAEQVCKFRAEFADQKITILRLFNVFGPNQRKEFLIPSIIYQIKQNKEIRVLDFNPKRDYIFIQDVISAIEKSMKPMGNLEIFNIGSGISYSVKEVIDYLQLIAGTSLPIYSELKIRKEEISDVIADISNAKKYLNWQPEWNFFQGLQETFRGEKL
jgi:GDP-4-dehydro-6-deoxy-D-mannose reductase